MSISLIFLSLESDVFQLVFFVAITGIYKDMLKWSSYGHEIQTW